MGKPLNVETDPDCDLDLHFDIWDLEKDLFFKLFEKFPKSQELAERAYLLRWGELGELNNKLSSEEELIQEAKKSIQSIYNLFPSDELKNPKIVVKYGNDKLRLELLSKAGSISTEVDDELCDLIEKANGENGYNAYFFLSEPMYRLSSSYIPSNWILWTLTDRTDIDPYTPLLKLYYNDCDVALTNDGVLIFKLNNEE